MSAEYNNSLLASKGFFVILGLNDIKLKYDSILKTENWTLKNDYTVFKTYDEALNAIDEILALHNGTMGTTIEVRAV